MRKLIHLASQPVPFFVAQCGVEALWDWHRRGGPAGNVVCAVVLLAFAAVMYAGAWMVMSEENGGGT